MKANAIAKLTGYSEEIIIFLSSKADPITLMETPVVVSVRNGQYTVLKGGNDIQAIKDYYGTDDFSVNCDLLCELTIVEETLWYGILNGIPEAEILARLGQSPENLKSVIKPRVRPDAKPTDPRKKHARREDKLFKAHAAARERARRRARQ